ncbi:26.2 kDa heat shock protein, mitochondrial-like [Miscanthus floridulus]|uniref:26.2 kDa heat shock protein, mitochondrial-like n=1 Tax=Miscanthus floridulus TaxID=154761 RepID=UPI00345AF850
MAFAVASKRAPLAVAGLLKKLLLAAPSASASGAAPAAAALRPAPACVVAARRLFSTGGAPFRRDDFDSSEEYSGDEEEEYSGDEDVVYDRLRSRGFSVSMFSSAGEPMSLGRLLALMEDEAAAAPRRECWVSKEDAAAVKLKVAMPGLGKEHVKVWADQDGLMIEGEGDKDTEYDDDEEAPAWYGRRIEFPADTFKMDQIKAEMKHGVLKVTVPKIKLEERENVFQVKVE